MASEHNDFGEKREWLDGVPMFIARPPARPAGVTFLLTAANVPLNNYMAIRRALLSVDQIVVGYMINVWKPLRNNHRSKAQNVHDTFMELKKEFHVSKFDIVGHAVGGKIALLVAALHNEANIVRNIIALDPIDNGPVEFTNATKPNLSLKQSEQKSEVPAVLQMGKDTLKKGKEQTADKLFGSQELNITMTFTDCGGIVPTEHNARAIHHNNRDCTKLVNNRNAGHMSYCNEAGISWKTAMNKIQPGNEARSKAAMEEALELIKDKNKSAATKAAQGLKADMKESLKMLKDDVKGAKGSAKTKAMSGVFKSMLK